MDILEPELIWVNGRCYRFFESNIWKDIHTSAMEPYMEDEVSDCSMSEKSESDIEIISHDGHFKHSFSVAKVFYPFIIGTKGTTLKKLESETKVSIEVPKKRKEGHVVLTAQNRKAIISARHKIDLLMEASKKKIRHTHFISIPLNTEEIIEKFNSFKKDVLEKYGETYNIHESLFQTPQKLHLTIGMLKLFDDSMKKMAIETLKNCKENIIEPSLKEISSMNIQLQGVACMNDDPTEVNVLYAKITPNETLQKLVDEIANIFVEAGLREKEYDKVKLHMTVMNIRFDDQLGYKYRFNASEIIKEHEATLFGEVVLNQIDISELHTATKDNYYKSIGSITF